MTLDHDLLVRLEQMPRLLRRLLDEVPETLVRRRATTSEFSIVEQVWHLADLEREGYGVRVTRLLTESAPRLADFDGARIARDREYLEADLALGLAVFADARRRNVERLRRLDDSALLRGGEQEGVGPVTLANVVHMMDAHDRDHARELMELLGELSPGLPVRLALATHAAAGLLDVHPIIKQALT
jgi:DinB family protein